MQIKLSKQDLLKQDWVKGFTQVKGVDYEETFAPFCRYESVRILLSLAAALNLEMIQFDVETAFLNSEMDMDEPVYMEQPEGFIVGHNMVCELQKVVYGLTYASRKWYETFKAILLEMNFHPLKRLNHL